MDLMRGDCTRVLLVFLHVSIALTLLFITCDARTSKHPLKVFHHQNKLERLKHYEMATPSDFSNTQPYVSSPFTLPPFDTLAPIPLPTDTPPYCESPPVSQEPPSAIFPSPMIYTTPPPQSSYSSPPLLPIQSPPPSPTYTIPSPPEYESSPPISIPGTPEYVPSPPDIVPGTPGYEPTPPIYFPSPTGYTPSPPMFGPGPPVFLPPIVYPPPSVPPPPHKGPSYALWCVAKPSVPEPIIQEAMNYACGSGADCGSIQPEGSCFTPDTLFAHASYAFNSYWQRTKVAGGTCDFGGTAILVTVDPSFDGCHFIYY